MRAVQAVLHRSRSAAECEIQARRIANRLPCAFQWAAEVGGRPWKELALPEAPVASRLPPHAEQIGAPRERAGEVNEDQAGAECVFLAPARPKAKIGGGLPHTCCSDTCVLLLMLDASRCHLQRKMAVDAATAR